MQDWKDVFDSCSFIDFIRGICSFNWEVCTFQISYSPNSKMIDWLMKSIQPMPTLIEIVWKVARVNVRYQPNISDLGWKKQNSALAIIHHHWYGMVGQLCAIVSLASSYSLHRGGASFWHALNEIVGMPLLKPGWGGKVALTILHPPPTNWHTKTRVGLWQSQYCERRKMCPPVRLGVSATNRKMRGVPFVKATSPLCELHKTLLNTPWWNSQT